jgi:hypothetical protein
MIDFIGILDKTETTLATARVFVRPEEDWNLRPTD